MTTDNGKKPSVYFTPIRILEFMAGSGAFLRTAYDFIIGNPPFGKPDNTDNKDDENDN